MVLDYRLDISVTKSSNGRRQNNKLRGGHLLPDGSREHRYTRELAEEILRRLATGETLTEICADPAIPVSTGAVRQWDVDDRDGWFSGAYARARRQQIEAWSDELLRIADDPHLEPNDRRVRLDTRKWLMSKLHPQRYGDKVQVGGDAANPIRHTVGVIDLAHLSDPELDALERFTDARLAAKDVQDHGE
jgi:Bacteriophage Sf6, terminase small subunit-like